MIPFLIIQYQLFVGLAGSIKAQPESASGLVSSAPYITVITSLFYPIVFVLPMTGLTGAAATVGVQVGYSIADVLAKRSWSARLVRIYFTSGESAATALSMLGAFGIAGRLITGALLDRFFAPRLALVILGIAGIGTFVLAYASTPSAAIAGTAILGFSLGSEGDITPYLIARLFGRKSFSTIYGLSWTAYAIGGATGPMLMGHLYDRFGAYQPRFVVGLACTCIAAALLNLLLPRYPAEIATPEAELVTAIDEIEARQ